MNAWHEKHTTCRYCGREIRHVGQWVSQWIHIASKSIWCDASATARARP